MTVAETTGAGVDPENPPVLWEAWTGTSWSSCDIEHDRTGGLNQSGEILLHVPAGHQPSVLDGQRAAWLRCRVVPARPGQPPFSASPRIDDVEAFTIGGTVPVIQAETVLAEQLGTSDGTPGQRFRLRRTPAIADDEPIVVESVGPSGRREWTAVPSFAGSNRQDRHVRLDHVTGEVTFGPVVREPDGDLRYYGAIPDKGDVLVVRRYRCGGGRRGNVARGAINVLKSSIPFVKEVVNRRPAVGGVDAEDIDNAKVRGPLALRTRDRAVTGADYEHLALQSNPAVARVRCATGDEPGAVRVLVVPDAADEAGKLAFEQLQPPETTLAAVADYLDELRMVGTRLVVEPPRYRGVTVVTGLRAAAHADQAALRRDALAALYAYLHPLRGGPDGTGWPFGRSVDLGEVYAVLHRLPGVDRVEQVQLFPANPITGERESPVRHMELARHELVFSFEHQVKVRGA
jgi:predicted phage baseplate assembly protein